MRQPRALTLTLSPNPRLILTRTLTRTLNRTLTLTLTLTLTRARSLTRPLARPLSLTSTVRQPCALAALMFFTLSGSGSG